jgi:hypothetical protein
MSWERPGNKCKEKLLASDFCPGQSMIAFDVASRNDGRGIFE